MLTNCRPILRVLIPLFLCVASSGHVSAQAIIEAVKRNDLATVQQLLQQNPQSVAATDIGGSTPLHWAARQGNLEIMQLLFRYRAAVNVKQREGDTPMHSAAVTNRDFAMQLLIEHGADPNVRSGDGNAAIHKAAQFGATFAVSLLLMKGVDVNAPNADGNTALAVAAWYGQMQVSQFLIAAGADLIARNKFGRTALDEASSSGKGDIAKMLADYQHSVEDRVTRDLIRKSSGLNLRTGFAAWTNPLAITKTVYSADFHAGTPGPEWKVIPGDSSGSLHISTTPTGARRFLGEFGNHSVVLSLANLPEHKEVAITFDLYIMRSMDGNIGYLGPDIWSLGLMDGPSLLQTTFMNFRSGVNSNLKLQAYPGEYPGDHNPPCAGAEEMNTLGYTCNDDKVPSMDSIYKIRYTFANSNRAIQFRFAGNNMSSADDESWGITNVQVAVGVTPVGTASTRAAVHPGGDVNPNIRPAPSHSVTSRPAPSRRITARRPAAVMRAVVRRQKPVSKPKPTPAVKRIHNKKVAPAP